MAETINCHSCGAANQLPEGKNSMFCAFCGNAIEKKIQISESNKVESSIRAKPEISKKKTGFKREYTFKSDGAGGVYDQEFIDVEIVTDEGGELSLNNRNISSLKEVIEWFSDNELKEIKTLNLSGNKIKNIDGLNQFPSLKTLDLSNNQIESFDPINSCKLLTKVNLQNNQIKEFPAKLQLKHLLKIDLNSNPIINISNFDGWAMSDGENIYYEVGAIWSGKKPEARCISCGAPILESTAKMNSGKCKICLPTKQKNKTDSADKNKNNQPSLAKTTANEISGGKCFIATATMGSYNHPTVIELRHFRDDWILEKSWGTGFVKWYYHYGAISAKSIEKSFVLKKISYLLIVKPLVYLSRILKG